MSGNLAKVKKKMAIYTKRRVRNVLSGNYGSVFKGRSMDFDDLRVYEYGDDVKDIDWKASARSKSPMIRRYVAIRKHNIMIVADSGRNMAAIAPSGEKKSDIATFAASIIAYIANQNSDSVGMVFGNESGNTRFPLKDGAMHIENFLDKYSGAVTISSSKPDLEALLTYLSKSFRERMFLFVVTDVKNANSISPGTLKRLRVRHDQMIIMVEDANISDSNHCNDGARDVVDYHNLPKFIRKDKALRNAEAKMKNDLYDKTLHYFKRYGICSCHIDNTEHAIPRIFKMLEEQKRVRR